MPLPFILGGLAIAAGLGGAAAGVNGAMKMSDANTTLRISKRKYDESRTRVTTTDERVKKRLDELGKKQLEVLGSFKLLADLIERIQNRPKMSQINVSSKDLPPLDLEKLKDEGIGAELLLGSVGGLATGTLGGLAASGATTTAVMALGTASTGTAISSLSGAAATNAALAALGGGSLAAGGGGMALGSAILGGATLGVGLLVGGVIFNFTGDRAVEKADDAYKEACKYEKKVNEICKFLDKLESITDQYMETFTTLSTLYYENFNKIRTLVDDGITDYNDFRLKEKLALKVLVNSCQILRKALRIKLASNFEKRELNPNAASEIEALPVDVNEIAELN